MEIKKNGHGRMDGRADRREKYSARRCGERKQTLNPETRNGDTIHRHIHTQRHHPSCRTGGNSSSVHCANASGKAATVADSLSGWVGDSSVGVRERE